MEQRQLFKEMSRTVRVHRIYEMFYVEHQPISSIIEESGYGRVSIYGFLRTFEAESPEIAEEMKKKDQEITLSDYEKLKQEIVSLKKELRTAKLRADFYEEMVAFGEEVYGIDLKKAGTK